MGHSFVVRQRLSEALEAGKRYSCAFLGGDG